MRPKPIASACLVAFSLLLAGCTGQFDVQQTEPIRVQLDGQGETAEVAEGDDAPQRFVVENVSEADAVEVEVEVTRVSDGPVTVVVTVQDGDTNETIAEEEIEVGGTGGNNTTSGTTTYGTTSAPAENGTGAPAVTATQNIFVDVKGKDNIVILTQAQEGAAEVNVAAREADATFEEDGNVTVTPSP